MSQEEADAVEQHSANAQMERRTRELMTVKKAHDERTDHAMQTPVHETKAAAKTKRKLELQQHQSVCIEQHQCCENHEQNRAHRGEKKHACIAHDGKTGQHHAEKDDDKMVKYGVLQQHQDDAKMHHMKHEHHEQQLAQHNDGQHADMRNAAEAQHELNGKLQQLADSTKTKWHARLRAEGPPRPQKRSRRRQARRRQWAPS